MNDTNNVSLGRLLAPAAREVLLGVLRDPEVRAEVRALLGIDTTPAAEDDSTALLSKQALARKLGVSASTVDRLTREGLPVAAFVGDARRYDLTACRAWCASRGKRPTTAKRVSKESDIDISDVAAAAGLTEVAQ